MTTISAKIILDSISEEGKRLTTVHMRYPRFIHSELMTHRVFSRNARSSRAVPVKTMLEEIRTDPVIPLFWGKNQKGMQAFEECNEPVKIEWLIHNAEQSDEWTEYKDLTNVEAWLKARDEALYWAELFMNAGYHKQVVNRLLEPFMHIDTLVSSTEWANFFWLRDHKDAEPHIDLLAKATNKAMVESRPIFRYPGEWHLPYVFEDDQLAVRDYLRSIDSPIITGSMILEIERQISAARCARISYAPFDGNSSIEKEMERYTQLIESQPVHASPVEHQATPDQRVSNWRSMPGNGWMNPKEHGNFVGWRQFRKTIPGEAVW